ncbi:TetR/AcrR family transcriptional regulator [Streptomyces sp. NPDC055078]
MDPDTPGSPGRRPGPKPRLSRERIVAAAVGLGIEQVSVNAVAAALDVSPASLYRYIAGLDDLLLAALESILATAPLPRSDKGWRAYLETEAATCFDLLTRYSGLLPESAADLEKAGLRRFEELVGDLVALGFTVDDAVLALDAVLDLVHDGAAQIVRLRSPGRETPAAPRSPEVRAAFRRIADAPQEHLWRKLTIVLDGLAVRRQARTTASG